MDNFELFDFEYPICDNKWKEEFESLFIDYFYFYEIGAETADRFKHNLKKRLRLIMPYYNELYKSTLFDIDPLITQKINETISDSTDISDTRTKNDSQTKKDNSTSSGNTDGQTTESEYPQTSDISSDIPSKRVGSSDRVSGSVNSSGELKNNSSEQGQSTKKRDYSRTIEGVQGNQNELLKDYRKNILNINKMIIEDLKPLFILVY